MDPLRQNRRIYVPAHHLCRPCSHILVLEKGGFYGKTHCSKFQAEGF